MKRSGFLCVAALLVFGCSRHKKAEQHAAPAHSAHAARPSHSTGSARVTPASYARPLLVPHTTGPIHCDGKAEESDWRHALRTGPFRDWKRGGVARPYSEARFVWDDAHLYVLFYAGDDDIHATVKKHDAPLWLQDAFSLKLAPPGGSTYDIDFAANGTMSDAREVAPGQLDPKWESHAVVGVDRDGTLNDSHDEDEEWLVETQIPFASLGIKAHAGTRLAVHIERCDKPHRGPRGCGVFAAPDSAAGFRQLELVSTSARARDK